MTHIINLDTNKLLKDFHSFKDKKTKEFSLDKHYPIAYFLDHTLALFASVPLKRGSSGLISMKKTMDATKLSDIHTISQGLTIPSINVRQLVMLVSEANRSLLMKPDKKNSTFKAFTPLFMYAHKLYNDVEYTEWDKDDEYINYALGRTLYNMLVFAKANKKPSFSSAEIIEMRTKYMTFKGGKKAGLTDKITGYKMNPDTNEYTADILRMELQTWVANAELRNEKALILDIWDWSNIPIPFDGVIEEEIIRHSTDL